MHTAVKLHCSCWGHRQPLSTLRCRHDKKDAHPLEAARAERHLTSFVDLRTDTASPLPHCHCAAIQARRYACDQEHALSECNKPAGCLRALTDICSADGTCACNLLLLHLPTYPHDLFLLHHHCHLLCFWSYMGRQILHAIRAKQADKHPLSVASCSCTGILEVCFWAGIIEHAAVLCMALH